MMIKNIIFDMGNVLLDYNADVSLDMYCNSKEEREVTAKVGINGVVFENDFEKIKKQYNL